HVPIIEGTNRNEGTLFTALAFDLNPEVGPLTTAEYPLAILSIADTLVQLSAAQLNGGVTTPLNATQQQKAQQIAQEILKQYPLRSFGNIPGTALSAVL